MKAWMDAIDFRAQNSRTRIFYMLMVESSTSIARSRTSLFQATSRQLPDLRLCVAFVMIHRRPASGASSLLHPEATTGRIAVEH